MEDRLNIMIVDDNQTNLSLMEMLIKRIGHFDIRGFNSAKAALAGVADWTFDLAIFDYRMPDTNGIELITLLRKEARFRDKPLVMVTVDGEREVRIAALEAGAVEFLTKPIEPMEFRICIRNLSELSKAQKALANQTIWLKKEVEKATSDLRWREKEIINCLARMSSYHDRETSLHTARMARYCRIMAEKLGLAEDLCNDLELAAKMHDVGKVGVREGILSNNGPLTDAERSEMQAHTTIGAAILGASECSLLRLAADIARSHHERWNGSGYPAGLMGNEIPIHGRIAAIADVFDALTTQRPYKTAWSVERAVKYIQEEAGAHFDPDCVAAFISCQDEILAAKKSFADHDTEYYGLNEFLTASVA